MYELLGRSIIALIFIVLTVLVCSIEDYFVLAINNNNSGEVIRCMKTEREALLKFKEGLIDEYGMMLSWGKGKDCCKWEGVQCSNTTGHVIGIQLQGNKADYLGGEINSAGDGQYYYLGGVINSALLELHHLNVLDLSHNEFRGNKFPEFICSMSQLQHLNLCWSDFFGTLPLEIGNLTNLESLDLSQNLFNGILPSEIGNLINLKTLDLSENPFSGTLPLEIGNLTNLESLDLSHNHFNGTLPTEIGNLINLKTLGLSGKQFSGTLPSGIGSLIKLKSLDLSFTHFPAIPPNITNLINLRTLDLSVNINFSSASLPSELWNLTNLESLYLSDNQLSAIPPEIGNLINLVSLDLSYNQLSAIPPEIGNLINLETLYLLGNINFSSISLPLELWKLTNLEYLDLSHNQVSAIPPEIGKLTNLESLYLSENQFSAIPPEIGNLINLETLDLSNNIIFSSTSFPSELWNLANLESLDLSYNQLSEIVHPRQWSLTNLKNIDLSGNDLTSSAIDSLFHMGTNHAAPSLRKLSLESNKLKWLPSSIWQFSMLEDLSVSYNSLMEGTITEVELTKLPNLRVLDLSYSSLTLNISPDWTPPFQLSGIGLSGCKVGPHFPLWLRTQSNYTSLDLSDSGISGEVPNWFWSLSPEAYIIDLSHNQLSGTISNFSPTGVVDLSFNKFSGPMPLLSPATRDLVISQNMFSGSLLFNCSLIFHNLLVLELYNNQLSGNLHNCWEKMPHLWILDIANNNFSGEIPHALGYMFELRILFLANNDFHGKLPSTLKECSNLQLIDIGDNMLNGSIPTWIGEYQESMVYLILRNNRFHGSIPPQICYLSHIQVLDLSGNDISGKIPPCFSNFTYLVSEDILSGFDEYFDGIEIIQYATILWKGKELKYGRTNLQLLKLIDLSRNKLDGSIPRAFSSMKTLHSLNLSRNRLTGMIDPDIGEMSSLESLDLSCNQLSGVIPNGMALLNFLSVLDLSNNSLSGKIPIGRQLQLFNASAYAGNIGLCGSPLQPCPGDRPDQPTNNGAQYVDEGDNGIMSISFLKDYGISIILGFVFGFWGVVGSLIVKESWRRVFYNFWDDVGDWVYVRVTIFWTRLRRSSS